MLLSLRRLEAGGDISWLPFKWIHMQIPELAKRASIVRDVFSLPIIPDQLPTILRFRGTYHIVYLSFQHASQYVSAGWGLVLGLGLGWISAFSCDFKISKIQQPEHLDQVKHI